MEPWRGVRVKWGLQVADDIITWAEPAADRADAKPAMSQCVTSVDALRTGYARRRVVQLRRRVGSERPRRGEHPQGQWCRTPQDDPRAGSYLRLFGGRSLVMLTVC